MDITITEASILMVWSAVKPKSLSTYRSLTAAECERMWFSTADKIKEEKIFAYQSYDIAMEGIPYKNASLAPATVPE